MHSGQNGIQALRFDIKRFSGGLVTSGRRAYRQYWHTSRRLVFGATVKPTHKEIQCLPYAGFLYPHVFLWPKVSL